MKGIGISLISYAHVCSQTMIQTKSFQVKHLPLKKSNWVTVFFSDYKSIPKIYKLLLIEM